MTGTGVVIRPLATPAEYAACFALQDETWGSRFSERVPATVLRVAQLLGGVASGAFDRDGTLLGFVFGMTGLMNGGLAHWSDMLAVRHDAHDRGIGMALKRHQRDVLLAHDVPVVHWTFDPLEARNAFLNIARLGAVARDYRRDYYGQSDSTLHAGIGTDRLVVTWPIASERVARRLSGEERPISAAVAAALPIVNPNEGPAPGTDVTVPAGAHAVRIVIPSSVQAIRESDMDRARAWRYNVRAAFEACFGAGFQASDVVRGDASAWYVLTRRA
jgi:predicted GNAT superfamily acetyltransferase